MDHARLLRDVAELEDPVRISELLVEALVREKLSSEDRPDGELLRRLGQAQIRLGHDARGISLLNAAVNAHPEELGLAALRAALQQAGEDLRAVKQIRKSLAAAPRAAAGQLYYLYLDLGYPALAVQASRRAHVSSINGHVRRWRFWWSTGGPFWFLRTAMRRREAAELDDRLGADDEMQVSVDSLLGSVRADLDTDRTAWTLVDDVTKLVEEGDLLGAARVLAEPISSDCRHPAVLEAAIDLAVRVDDSRLALQLCAAASSQTGRLALRRARSLFWLDRLKDAWAAIDNDAAEEVYRDLRAQILLDAGLTYLAVSVRGGVTWERRQWYERWWRTGGPLWFVRARGERHDRGNFADRIGRRQPTIEALEPSALAEALTLAVKVDEVLTQSTSLPALDTIKDLSALNDRDRPSLRLLDQLAWAYYRDDQDDLALLPIREARALEPADAGILYTESLILMALDRYAEALDIAKRYAAEFGQPGLARLSSGNLYDNLGFYTLSLDRLGPREGLSVWAQNLRRKQWWRTGGPIDRWRARIRRTDESNMASWQERAARLNAALTSVVGPAEAVSLRVYADHFIFRESSRRSKWNRVKFVGQLFVGFAGSLVGGVVLARIFGKQDLWFVINAVVGGLIILGLLRPTYRLTRGESGDRILTRAFPAVGIVGVAGYLTTRADGLGLLLLGVAVVAVAAVAALRLLVAVGARIAEALALRQLRRDEPRGFAIVSLLDVLAEFSRPTKRNDLTWRRQQLQTLEQVAVTIESSLPAIFAVDPSFSELLRRRGQSAATAIRELKYLLVAMPPGAGRRIEQLLRQDVAALATGSLSRLRAVEPPAPQIRRRSRIELSLHVAKTMFFAGLPLAVVVSAQPWLRFNETILNWARLLTLGWAVLYVLMTADSTFREKLRVAFALINLSRGAGESAPENPPVPERRDRR
ncbi:hypothetical protein [Actinoplanes sp. NPDC026619]|uniref:hypothetical protein n=1 Tax=Actinoplanes sp. NPDC026619 TaxID=3155798 RepID=UPI0033F1A2F9